MLSKRRGPALALAMLVALLTAGAPAGTARAAAADARKAQKFKDWTVECEPANAKHGRRCVLAQNLRGKNGDKVRQLMSTVVGRFGGEVGFAILFTVPLGVFLPAGLVLEVDGGNDKKRLDYQFCTRSGCRAALKLDDHWLGRLKAGSKATVTIEGARHKDIALPLSLHGFTDGLAKVAAQ